MRKYSVGVVVATYNGARYLNEQLESLLNQTIPPDKIIIVDDCSLDNTVSLATKWQEKNPKLINIFRGARNSGYIRNFERGISLCDQHYIALSDQDDVWESKKIEKCIEKLKSYPDAGLCYHNAQLIDYNGNFIGVTLDKLNRPSLPLDHEYTRNRILANWGSPIRGFSIVFENKLKKYLLPMPGYKFCPHDWWISAIAFFLYNPVYIDESLVRYRIHEDQVSGPLKNVLCGTEYVQKKRINAMDIFVKIVKELVRIKNLPKKYVIKMGDSGIFKHEMKESFQRLVYYINNSDKIDNDECRRRAEMVVRRMDNL